jgi:hypothetical protein
VKNKLKLLSYRYSKLDNKFLVDKRLEDLETIEYKLTSEEHFFLYAGFRLPSNEMQEAVKQLLPFGNVLNCCLHALTKDELKSENLYKTSFENLMVYTDSSVQSEKLFPFLEDSLQLNSKEKRFEYDDLFFDSDILWLIAQGYEQKTLADLKIFTIDDLHEHYCKLPGNEGFIAFAMLFKRTLESKYLNNKPEEAVHAIWHLSRYIPGDIPINANLTVRTSNALKVNQISNYKHFSLFKSPINLSGIPKLGIKSLIELENIVKGFYKKHEALLIPQDGSSLDFIPFLQCLSQQTPRDKPGIIAGYIIELCHFLPKQFPINEVFSVRTNNVLKENNITHYNQLTNYTATSLLSLPKLGATSVRELYSILKSLPDKYASLKKMEDLNLPLTPEPQKFTSSCDPLLSPDTEVNVSLNVFSDVLSEFFTSLKHNESKVLFERLKGSTLEDVGNMMTVTRERVRQIQTKGISTIYKLIKSHEPELKLPASQVISFLNGLLTEHSDYVSIGELLRATSAIKTEEKYPFILSVINKFLELESIELTSCFVTLREQHYLIPFYKKTDPEKSIKMIKDWLDKQRGVSIEKICNDSAMLHKSIASPYFVKVLTLIIMNHTGQIAEGVYEHEGNWKPSETLMQASKIVMNSPAPMKLDDIYEAMPETYRERFHDSRRLSGILANNQSTLETKKPHYLFNITYGYWCTWAHINLSESDGQKIVKTIQDLVATNKSFQFSDQEIFKSIKKSNSELDQFIGQGQLDPHIISLLLNRYRPEKIEYLGRSVWRFGDWTDKPNGDDRVKYSELLKEYLLEKQQFVSEKEFLAHVSSFRGSSKTTNYQVPKNEDIIWLTTLGSEEQLIWHKSLNPLSPNSDNAKVIFTEARNIVVKMRSFTNLKFMFRKSKPILREHRFTDIQLAALLCQCNELTAFFREGKLWFSAGSE